MTVDNTQKKHSAPVYLVELSPALIRDIIEASIDPWELRRRSQKPKAGGRR